VDSGELGDIGRRLLLRVSDAIVELDRDWHYTFVNEQAARLFGRTREQLEGKHIWTEFPEGVGQPFHLAYERAMREQKPISFEAYYEPWGRWFENRVYPSQDGLSIFFHEITDRKRAEHEREAANELNRHIIESAYEGIAVVDREMRYQILNPALASLVGLEVSDMLGKRPRELFRESIAREFEDRIARAWSGETIRTDEFVIRDAAGRQRYMTTTVRPLHDNGAVTDVLVFVDDRTAELAAKAGAVTTAERLASALSAARAGVWEWDLTTGEVLWSAESREIWGVRAGTIEGSYAELVALVHADDRAELERRARAAIETATSYEHEFRIIRPDGERWVHGTGRVLVEDGRPVRMVGTIIDITPRKHAELQTELHNRVLEDVAMGRPSADTLGELARGYEQILPGATLAILIADQSRQYIELAIAPTLPEAYETAWRDVAIGPTAGCASSIYTGTRIASTDISTDEHWAGQQDLAASLGLHRCLSVPFFDRSQQPRGALAIYSAGPTASYEQEGALLDGAVRIASVIVEHDDALRARVKSEEELRRLSATVLRTQDEERRRIARELHDTTGQNLAALAMDLSLLQKDPDHPARKDLLAECAMLARIAATELRTLSYVLHPPMLEDFGLERAIQELATGLRNRSGLDVSVAINRDVGRLAPEAELALFRVVQEALANVSRHAAHSCATVRLDRTSSEVVVEVEDPGLGSAAPPTLMAGVGIAAMRERARELGGSVDVQLGKERTVVRARLPLREFAR
jgi:PAS domain S-box-containing protein